jgi:hypothetical protein
VGIRLPADQAKAALFEAIVCGLSSDTGEIAAFHIAPTLDAELEIVLSEIDLSAGTFRVGHGADQFDAAKKELSSEGIEPSCLQVIGEVISKQLHQSVGGFLQAATVDRTGFYLNEILNRPAEGKEFGDVRFLGFDVGEIRRPEGYKFGQRALMLGRPPVSDNQSGVPELFHTSS